jgi:hypothetical protein
MKAVSPVMPGSEAIEEVLAEDQPEYDPLPVVICDTESRPMVSRWRLSEEERSAIAAGADIILQQLTFGCQFQPVNLQIVMPDEAPALLD